MVGVFLDDAAQAVRFEEFLGIVFQMEGDNGSALALFGTADGIFRLAAGLPQHGVRGIGTGLAGQHFDFSGNNEGGIEADAELTDQLGILLLVAGQ